MIDMGSVASEPTPPSATATEPISRELIHRPWGWFEPLAAGKGYLVKRLQIEAGRRISLQRHRHRCEHWLVVAGNGILECEGRSLGAVVGSELFIPQGALHRAGGGDQALVIIEVQRGDDLREDDIERFADDFGRVVP